MKTIILFLLSFFTINSSRSQVSIDFQKSLDIALSQDIKFKQQLIQNKINSNDVSIAKKSLLPAISLTSNNNLYLGRQIQNAENEYTNVTIPNSNFNINSQIYLFKAFQNTLTIQLQNVLKDVNQHKTNQLELDISLSTFSSYVEYLYSIDATELIKNRIVYLNLKKEQIQYMNKIGALSKGHILDIQSQLNQEEINLLNSIRQKNEAYINLKKILNLAINDTFTIVRPLELNQPINYPIPTIIDYLNNQFPNIKSKEKEIIASQYNQKIIKFSTLPTLRFTTAVGTAYSKNNRYYENKSNGLNGMYLAGQTLSGEPVFLPQNLQNNYEIPWKNQLKNQLGIQFGLQLNIPIINSLNLKQRKNTSLQQTLTLENDLELLKRENQQKILTIYNEYKINNSLIEVLKKNVITQTELVNIYWEKYTNGLATNIEYRFACNNLQQTQAELLHYQYDLLFKSKLLNFYCGIPIELK